MCDIFYHQGLHPESHGIVNNFFFDASLQEEFKMTVDDVMSNPKWWLGEPVSWRDQSSAVV